MLPPELGHTHHTRLNVGQQGGQIVGGVDQVGVHLQMDLIVYFFFSEMKSGCGRGGIFLILLHF